MRSKQFAVVAVLLALVIAIGFAAAVVWLRRTWIIAWLEQSGIGRRLVALLRKIKHAFW